MPARTAYRRPYTRKPAKATVSRYPKKTFRRKPYNKAVANTVKRVLATKLEKKWMDTVWEYRPLINLTYMVFSLTNVPSGTTGNTRVGEVISPVNLTTRLTFYQGIPQYTTIRVVIFKTLNKGFIPTSDTIGAWNTANGSTYSITNNSNLRSYINNDPGIWDQMSRDEGLQGQLGILSDRKYTCSSRQPGTPATFNFSIKLSGKMHFTVGGNGADKGLYACIMPYNAGTVQGATFNPANGTQATTPAGNTTGPAPTFGGSQACFYEARSRFVYTDA